jgi:DNA-directed RNA polymerase subunit RPC12/RpoP
MGKKFTYTEVKNIIEKENGYILISEEYINNRQKLKIKHLECNNLFEMAFTNFYNSGNRCPYCANKIRNRNNKYKISDINSYMKKFGYECLSKEYQNYRQKLKIKHLECNNIFEMTFDNFKNGKNRCPYCSNHIKYTIEDVKKIIKDKDPDYECLSEEYINNKTNLKIKHLKCNNIYEVNLNNFLNKENRCPYCKTSKGEKIINDYLLKNNIKFIREYKFENCKDKRVLPFDFYLEDYNILIEYDGELHYKESRYRDSKYNKDKLNKQILHDNIKNEYCKNNHIKLIRIPYTEFNNIEEILKEELNL